MTTQEVADKLVTLCREGKYEQAVKELYSKNIISVEPEGTPDRVAKGIEAIIQKGINFSSMVESINSNEVTDPLVAENFFSIGMNMNMTMKGAPEAIDMQEICVYTVAEGKIVREEFFYSLPPQDN